MPRASKKAPKKDSTHEFSLKPCTQHIKRPQHLSLSFCGKQGEQRSLTLGHTASCCQAPTYNKDQSHASPAFVLPSDNDYYRMRREDIIKEHDAKFDDYTDEKSTLMVPKPRTKSCYCSVCKVHYEDYLQHIQSVAHRRKLGANVFTRYISELSQHLKVNTTRTARLHQLVDPSAPESQEDDVQEISSPTKKIKVNQTVLDLTQNFLVKKATTQKKEKEEEQQESVSLMREHRFQPEMNRQVPNPSQQNQVPQGQTTINLTYNMNYYMNPYNYFSPFNPNYLCNLHHMNQMQMSLMSYFPMQNYGCFNQIQQKGKVQEGKAELLLQK